MRKLLTIFLLTYIFQGKAQIIQYLGGPTTQIYVRGQLRVDTLIYLPVTDTLIVPSQPGAIVYKSSNSTIYWWNGIHWNAIPTPSVVWGQISGFITNQTDLINYLAAHYEPLLTFGYGIKQVGSNVTYDSATIRKVDTLYRLNDSTIQYILNGRIYNLLIRGTAAGGISSLVFTVPTVLYNSPVTFSNSGGAWTGTLALLNQNPNFFFAGPTTGGAAAPSFRLIGIGDLPVNIPNAYLQNSTIGFVLGSSGTDVGWTLNSVALGGTQTLNIPTAGPTSRGVITSTMYTSFTNKVDSATLSNDSIYEWRNGAKTFRYLLPISTTDPNDILLYGIPEPTGSGVNGTPITWIWLTGGGHTFSSNYLDSCIFVAGSGHILIGFPTAQAVMFGTIAFDEQTFPFQCQVIGNLDNFDFGVWVQASGIGVNLVGNGTSTWQIQSSTLSGYNFIIDTSTQGIVSFDLIDPSNAYLGATTNGTIVDYNGSNGYTLNRLWSGLTRNYRYQLLDASGNPARITPSSSDRLTIFNGSTFFNFIDQRQFLTSTNSYFASGLPNYWFFAVVRKFPDSLKVIRPTTFAAVAGGSAGTINISWSAVSNAANGYQLDRSTNPNFSGGVTTLVNLTNVTSYADAGLVTGTVYYYRLRASRVSNVYSGWELRSVTAP